MLASGVILTHVTMSGEMKKSMNPICDLAICAAPVLRRSIIGLTSNFNARSWSPWLNHSVTMRSAQRTHID